jgi:hypothetical protein
MNNFFELKKFLPNFTSYCISQLYALHLLPLFKVNGEFIKSPIKQYNLHPFHIDAPPSS